MEEEVEYLSLYEYLGRAAGSKLGKIVMAIALEEGVTFRQKNVPHSGFKQRVITYPKHFLVEYFHPTHKDNELNL